MKQVQVVFPRIHTKYLNKLDTDAPLTLNPATARGTRSTG